MDPILIEVYSTVLPAAPYVIGAYVGIWVVFIAFVIVLWGRARKTQADIEVLKRALERRDAKKQG